MSWLDSTRENMFKHSLEKKDLKKAMLEWEYAGNVYDSEENLQTCELCEHPELRYQFEIVNRNNQNSLWVGSECIKKFSGVSVLGDDGQILNSKERASKLDKDKRKLIENAQTKSILNSLVALSWVDKEFEIEDFVEYFQKNSFFTPKQVSTIVWRLDTHNIKYKKSYLKISIKRGREKNQLLQMQDWQLKKIWDCLSSSQKKWVEAKRKFT
ncbi:MAG: hypothetical protein WBK28_00260 [Minisyncoccia bacterium]